MSLPKGKTTKKTEENTMTRFERELSGALGAYWKASAEKELAEIKTDLENGKITIGINKIKIFF